jgi:hypothetical protein
MSAEENLAILTRRRDDIRAWLAEAAHVEICRQGHLEADTPEQAYWHHGYQAALDDMITLLSSKP